MNNGNNDPLNLNQLFTLASHIKESLDTTQNNLDIKNMISSLLEILDKTNERYTFLKDRYSLLKRSNAALSDELVWLRDQLDDLQPQENLTTG